MYALLFDLDIDEAAVLTLVLQRSGFSVKAIKELDVIVQNWLEQPAEALMVAVRRNGPLPHLNALTSQLRSQSDVPIIIISDPIDEDLQVNLLDAGADLIVLRPFSARMLIAQIRSLLRRTGGVPFFSLPLLNLGKVTLDPASRTVQVGQGADTRLTQLEFRLLYTLMMHPGQVIPAETLVEHVWGFNGQGDRDLVRGLIRRLRTKVEPEPQKPQYIVTMPGIGYVFQI